MTKSQIDEATVKRIAHLARVKVSSQEAHSLQRELNGILAWVEELNAIPTEGVVPLTSVGGAQAAYARRCRHGRRQVPPTS